MRQPLVVAAAAVAALVGSLVVPAASATSTRVVAEFSAGIPPGAAPNGIARGPDKAMWFTEYDADKLGRIAANGSVTEYPSSGTGLTAGADPSGVVAGPDGNLWFTEYGTGGLGALNPTTGKLVGEYPVPAGVTAGPQGIVVGPDGALWFTERGVDQIGRLDVSMATPGTSDGFSEFAIPSNGGHIAAQPVDLVDGGNHTMWVTLASGGVASVVPAGSGVDTTATITRYKLPTAGSAPEGIVLGPDKDVWVAEDGADKIAKVVPGSVSSGTSQGITEYPAGGAPLWLSNAGDGALWATDNTGNSLIRFDLSTHKSTTYGSAQGVTGDATADAEDPSGNLWFTEFVSNKVGEVALRTVSDLKRPRVIGKAKTGKKLSCNPGTWSGKPTFKYLWNWFRTVHENPVKLASKKRTIGMKYARLKRSSYFKHQKRFTLHEDWQIRNDSTLKVPALPAGGKLGCSVIGSIAKGSLGGQTVPAQHITVNGAVVPTLPGAPYLLRSIRLRNGKVKKLPAPHIHPHVGAAETNTCTPGTWANYPALDAAWYSIGIDKNKKGGTKLGKLLHDGSTFTPTPNDVGLDIECVITAKNRAGTATAHTNHYVVPDNPPQAVREPFVQVSTSEPTGGGLVGPEGASVIAEQVDLTCTPPQWDQSGVHTDPALWYRYDATGNYAGDSLPVAEGSHLDFDMRPGKTNQDADLVCVYYGFSASGNQVGVAASGAIQVWSGCNAYTETDYSNSVELTPLWEAAAVLSGGGVVGILLDGTQIAYELANGTFDFQWPLDPSITAYTYGPNCEDYQKYLQGQGDTVKQQPGDGP